MSAREEALQRLAAIPHLTVSTDVPLSRYTRFGIGGPAVELEEIARAALLVVSGATGAVIARAAAVARAGEDAEVRAADGRPLRI